MCDQIEPSLAITDGIFQEYWTLSVRMIVSSRFTSIKSKISRDSSSSTVDAAVTLSSAFAANSRVYLHSVSDVSLLSVDALNSLLLSESFMVDSEDALLHILFMLGHPPLLRHIRWEFVSAAAIASLCANLTFCPPTESLWLAISDRLLHSPPPPLPAFDS
jgi:hypothetical protein